MTRGRAGLVAVVALALVPAAAPRAADIFAWLAGDVSIDDGDRRRMSRRDVVSRVLDASGDGLGLFLASAVDVDAIHFARAATRVEELWKHEGIPEVAAFSSEPRDEDVATLTLDEKDREALAACEPGDCDVKLSAREMATIRAAIASAGVAGRRAAALQAFRRVVVARARAYLAAGLRGAPPYADKRRTVSPHEAYARTAARLSALTSGYSRLARYLLDYPRMTLPEARSRLFWLKTTYTPRHTVQIIHVVVVPVANGPGRPRVVVAWRQVYASHYIKAWVSLSAVTEAGTSGPAYLTYINRSEVDGLGGFLAPIKRFFVERRVRDTAARLFALQRGRLEGLTTVPD